MKRNVFLIVGIVILSALGSNVFADTIDVVYLKNGSIIKGIVIEIYLTKLSRLKLLMAVYLSIHLMKFRK